MVGCIRVQASHHAGALWHMIMTDAMLCLQCAGLHCPSLLFVCYKLSRACIRHSCSYCQTCCWRPACSRLRPCWCSLALGHDVKFDVQCVALVFCSISTSIIIYVSVAHIMSVSFVAGCIDVHGIHHVCAFCLVHVHDGMCFF